MESTSPGLAVHPVVEAIGAVDGALDKTRDAAVWGMSDDDLGSGIAGCERVLGRQAELRARLIAEADGRDLGRRAGASSTRAWLRDRFRLRPGDAKWQLQLGNRITAAADGPQDYAANVGGPISGREMPETGKALADGAISVDAAVIIARTMSKLPRHVSVEQAQQAESDLAGWAREHDPATLGKLAWYLLHVLETDTLDDDEADRYDRRDLRLDESSGRIAGRLDREGLATVRTVLDELAKPCPAEDGTPDPRSPGRRLADALVELARRALGANLAGNGTHGIAHKLLISAGIDALGHDCQDDGQRSIDHPDDDTHDDTHDDDDDDTDADTDGDTDDGDDVGAAARAAVGDADSRPSIDRDEAAGGDQRPGWVRPGDDGSGAGKPDGHGTRPGCPLGPAAAGGVAPGELVFGGPLPAAAVRRIACFAGIQRVIVDPMGAVLNVGREYRTVTPAQFVALIARDNGCAFPGCTRPAAWCIAHHIIHWADGGPTNLDNLVLLCTHHHMSVHHRGWDVRIASDRLPEFIPPPWVDPDKTPRRNNRPRYSRRPPPDE